MFSGERQSEKSFVKEMWESDCENKEFAFIECAIYISVDINDAM